MSVTGSFTKWDEPATRGDVVTAMIWTQGLIQAAIGLAVAQASGDSAAFASAFTTYRNEMDDFRSKIDTIGGLATNGE